MNRLLLFIIVALTLAPHTASAAIDPRCFTRSECLEQRATQIPFDKDTLRAIADENGTASLSGQPVDDTASGFFSSSEYPSVTNCPNEILNKSGELEEAGFCLAGGEAEARISIGGRRRFASLADYISAVYTYGISIGSILAIFMIIIAGVQWTVSGGSETAIRGAKDRIAQALTGLLLLLTSYVILYTVNPELVQLREPRVWLIKGSGISGLLCTSLDKGTKVTATEQVDGQPAVVDAQEALCGTEYNVGGGGGQTCGGAYCPPENGVTHSCLSKMGSEEKPTCVQGNIVGNIYASDGYSSSHGWGARYIYKLVEVAGLDPTDSESAPNNSFADGWAWSGSGWSDTMRIYPICNDGTYSSDAIGNGKYTNDSATRRQTFTLTVDSANEFTIAERQCEGRGGLLGYALSVAFSELGSPFYSSYHFLGNNNGDAIDLGPHYSISPTSAVLNVCLFQLGREYLLSKEDIISGMSLNIDVSKIADIDALDTVNSIFDSTARPTGALAQSFFRSFGGNSPSYVFNEAVRAGFGPAIAEFDAYYGRLGLDTAACLGIK